MVMATELKQVFRMNEGTDDTSYAKTSYIQKQVLTLTKPLKEQAIRKSYCKNLPKTMCIADLGCSSAELNTLSLITELIDTVEKARRKLGNEPQEYQVYLNDLPGNDFNTIFRSLGNFEDMLKKKTGDEFGQCFVSGVPGSFYGRLFPSNHLHFVHSSYSVHWLSQIPKGIENNKGNVYISKTSPSNVAKAYSDQFENDFSTFLSRRSEEVVVGGMMVLTMLGRKTEELYSKESCYMYDLLATALNSMVFEGLIDEEKLNTYNIPQYPPSAKELSNLVEKEGSFSFDQVHVCDVSWEANECYKYSSKDSDHYDFYKCMRSVVEPLLTSHFGEAIIEEIFKRYKVLIQNAMALENNVFINVTISLTRKG
ncbi:salicylate carboxymethyltransferase-like [Chenopodium quinoa]|uniref:Uncharacterized protein n=1 Tax=Chenopodium quinoa TaxID=63459 RepID=A0A803LZL7_CHEQI|nr:salicylate carboxymethyltransferase-like [Chenopodium quinoa]